MRYFIVILILLISVNLYAKKDKKHKENKDKKEKTIKPEETKFWIGGGPVVSTSFPIWTGVGAEIIFLNHISLSGEYGTIPSPYKNVLGTLVSEMSNNSAYKTLLNEILKKNSGYKANLEFSWSERKGWIIGSSYYYITAKGDVPIVESLEAVTGVNYSSLKTLLAMIGVSENVHVNSEFHILEVYSGYRWEIFSNFYIASFLGAAQIFKSDFHFKSDSPLFDNSEAGKVAYEQSRQYLIEYIDKYGIAPILGLNFNYIW